MPEILTKHPEIVKKILHESCGAQCGTGASQQILKSCPRRNFCALKTGELCVYGLDEIDTMTQFGRDDICGRRRMWYEGNIPVVASIFFVAGALLTMVFLKRKRQRARQRIVQIS